MQYSIACLAVSLLLAACQTTSSRTPASRAELVEGLIKVTTTACTAMVQTKEEDKAFLEALNISVQEVCDCAYRKFFGEMSEADLDRFIDDAANYGRELTERDPWKRQLFEAAIGCMSKGSQGLAMQSP